MKTQLKKTTPHPASPVAPMTAVVEYQIRSANHNMREWLEVWSKHAEDAQEHEPETSAYATAVNLDDPNNVVIFERYTHARHSIEQPIQRQAHADLLEVMSASFTDLPSFGFWSRTGSPPTQHSRLTLLGLRFSVPEMQTQWLNMVGEHATYCYEQELPTLIYSAGIAKRNAEHNIDVCAGDLIVVMLSADEAGVTVHQNDKRHLALQAAFASKGIERELVFLRRFRVTGDGYWWR